MTLPPLRAPAEDILLLAEEFLYRYSEAHGVRPNRLSRAADLWLCSYRWPGNVRELSHLPERVTLLSHEAIVSPSTLASLCLSQPLALVSAETPARADVAAEIDERAEIQAALRQTHGNVVQAAQLLGLSRGALRHRLHRYGLQSPRVRPPASAMSGDQPATELHDTSQPVHAAERPTTPFPAWEHKPVAVLALELTFPTATARASAACEPWTAARRWEQALVAKVQGFGRVILQRSPSLLLAVHWGEANDPSLAPLKTLLTERTEGNPFLLEESVQTLVDTRELIGAPAAYRLTQVLPRIQVPATVQAVLAARIDRLPPEEKRLLQTAAVIGPEIPIPLLYTLAELSEDALYRGLNHLQATEFLYETRLFPDRVYTFKDALTQQVAYEMLLQERQRLLHARIVEALEVLSGTAWRNRSNAWPTMTCAARSGIRP